MLDLTTALLKILASPQSRPGLFVRNGCQVRFVGQDHSTWEAYWGLITHTNYLAEPLRLPTCQDKFLCHQEQPNNYAKSYH